MWYDVDDQDSAEYKAEAEGPLSDNLDGLKEALVGRKVVAVSENNAREDWDYYRGDNTVLMLDNGTKVTISDTHDCCAYTTVESVVQHLPELDHIITGVQADDGHNTFHILADLGEVLELQVDWSPGNPFYYGYGLHIEVESVQEADSE